MMLLGRIALLALPCVLLATGCSSLQRPREATLADSQPQPRHGSARRASGDGARTVTAAKNTRPVQQTPVVDVADPTIDPDGWLARTRRRLDLVAREIKADLDFHDSEGLDAFAPDAAAQVDMLRNEMNGPSDITR